MSEEDTGIYEFGPFRLDTRRRVLLREGEPVDLPSKAYETLVVLVRSSGQVLERDELIKRIWPDSFVEEANLSVSVSALRKAMGESASSYILTVPRRGYHFAANVRQVPDDGEEMILARRTRTRVVLREEDEPQKNSIAVLPFKRLSADAEDQYLGVGIADALITRLSSIHQIVVRPTSAIIKYADAQEDPVEIGQALVVESVIDGSIQKSGGRVRVTAQLISVSQGRTLWADKYDERFTDIFAVEDRVSQRIIDSLMLKLTADERMLLAKRYTENIEAYELYLQGHFYFNKATREAYHKAIDYFHLALGIDPEYALANMRLAECYILLALNAPSSSKENFARARAAAQKALEMDEHLSGAHAVLGAVKMFDDWDWDGADREFQMAFALNPNQAPVHAWYAYSLSFRGRHDEAIDEVHKARSLDSDSIFANTLVAEVYCFARFYDDAIATCARSLEIDPTYPYAHYVLAAVYDALGDYDRAISEFRKASNSPASSFAVALSAYSRARSGFKDEAGGLLDKLKERGSRHPVSPFAIALVHVGLDEKDEAFEWLEKAYEEHDYRLIQLNVSARMDSLRADARFGRLLQRIGLAQ